MSMRLVMGEHEITADRKKWTTVRRKTIGASDIASIMGVTGAYSSATAVFWNKVAGDDIPSTLKMEIGNRLEALAAELFNRRFPTYRVMPGGLYVNEQRPWQSATFDRLATSGRSPDMVTYPVQIKTSNTTSDWGPDGSDEIPPHYLAQVLWEMSVGSFTLAYVPVIFLGPGELRVYQIPWDENAELDVKVMLAEAAAFLELVRQGKPPAVDWRPVTTRALKRIYAPEGGVIRVSKQFERDLRRDKERRRQEKERRGLLENRLREMMGTATVAVNRDGVVVAERIVYQRRGFVAKPCTVDRIDIKDLKEN